MGFSRHRFPKWQPSDDLPDIWLDATQTGTGSLQDTSGGSISDGETIGKWISQGSDASEFIQVGSDTRPTFASSGINSLSAMRSNDQILGKMSLSGYASMTGMTVIVVQMIAATTPTDATSYGFTVSHDSGVADTSLVYIGCCFTNRFVGGRRLQSNSFSQATGETIAINTPHIQTAVFDWTNAKLSFHQNCKLRVRDQTFQTGGSTSAVQPFGHAVGAFIHETGTTRSLPINGWVGEVLMWKNRVFTPAQLVGPHAYIARKWNPTGAVQFRQETYPSLSYSFPSIVIPKREIIRAYQVHA